MNDGDVQSINRSDDTTVSTLRYLVSTTVCTVLLLYLVQLY